MKLIRRGFLQGLMALPAAGLLGNLSKEEPMRISAGTNALEPEHKLANFIGTPETLSAVRAFLHQRGPTGLVIQGGPGKTHLAQAIALQAAKDCPHDTVIYVEGRQFMKECLRAVTIGRLQDFAATYASADMLVFDNIDWMANGELTQNQLPKILLSILSRDGKILVTRSNEPFEKLMPELRTFIASSKTITLARLEPGAMAEILQRRKMFKKIPTDVLHHIIRTTKSLREADLLALRVSVHSQLNNLPLTVTLVDQLVNANV